MSGISKLSFGSKYNLVFSNTDKNQDVGAKIAETKKYLDKFAEENGLKQQGAPFKIFSRPACEGDKFTGLTVVAGKDYFQLSNQLGRIKEVQAHIIGAESYSALNQKLPEHPLLDKQGFKRFIEALDRDTAEINIPTSGKIEDQLDLKKTYQTRESETIDDIEINGRGTK